MNLALSTPLTLAAAVLLSSVAHGEVRLRSPKSSDQALAARVQAALGADSAQVNALELELETPASLGETSDGYLLERRRGRVILSNGEPFRRALHGSVTKAPQGGLVRAQGTRVAVGGSTVDVLEFSNAEEAMTYVNRGSEFPHPGTGTAFEVRGRAVLAFHGEQAGDPQAFAKLRQAVQAAGPLDALVSIRSGDLLISGRLGSRAFRSQFSDAVRSIRSEGERKGDTTIQRLGDEERGHENRVTLDRQARSLQIASFKVKARPLIESWAKSFTEQFVREAKPHGPGDRIEARKERAGLRQRLERALQGERKG